MERDDMRRQELERDAPPEGEHKQETQDGAGAGQKTQEEVGVENEEVGRRRHEDVKWQGIFKDREEQAMNNAIRALERAREAEEGGDQRRKGREMSYSMRVVRRAWEYGRRAMEKGESITSLRRLQRTSFYEAHAPNPLMSEEGKERLARAVRIVGNAKMIRNMQEGIGRVLTAWIEVLCKEELTEEPRTARVGDVKFTAMCAIVPCFPFISCFFLPESHARRVEEVVAQYMAGQQRQQGAGVMSSHTL